MYEKYISHHIFDDYHLPIHRLNIHFARGEKN